MTRRARSWFSPARGLIVALAVTMLGGVMAAMPAQAVSSNDLLTVATPENGTIYALDQVVYPHVEVADPSAVFMILFVVDGRIICQRAMDPFDCDPPVPIDTSTIGSHSLEFRVYDEQLNIISSTHYYLVGGPNQPDSTDPTVQIAAPADGGSYTMGQLVEASYSCSDIWLVACDGDVQNRAPIDTSTLGAHTFSVHAADYAGNTTTRSVSYEVVAPPPPQDTTYPQIQLTRPPMGASYTLGQTVLADYTCSDEPGGSGLASCVGDVPSGSPVDTSTAGVHEFHVSASDYAGNTVHGSNVYTVLAGSIQDAYATPGGIVTTDPGGLGATADVPVQTSLEASSSGTVSITAGSITEPAPSSYSFLGQQVTIEAPPAPDADHPLIITFSLDASLHPDPSVIQISRDGVLLSTCDAAHSVLPCAVVPSSIDANGDLAVTVYTLHASTWNFAVHQPFVYTGFFQPVDNPPTLNSVKAGSAIPVKFSLGGNQSLAVLARGYPVSQKVTCSSTSPIDAIEQTVNAGSSSLTFSSSSNQYTYVWKSDSTWAGTCRRFTLKLADGSSHQAYFKFTK